MQIITVTAAAAAEAEMRVTVGSKVDRRGERRIKEGRADERVEGERLGQLLSEL